MGWLTSPTFKAHCFLVLLVDAGICEAPGIVWVMEHPEEQ